MRKLWLVVFVVAVFTSCADYQGYVSHISPDGKHVIDITTEIQAANDPDVFWQHVSVRPATTEKPIVPGNVAVYSCYSPPVVTWKNNTEAELEIELARVGASFYGPPKPKSVNGVHIVFKLKLTKDLKVMWPGKEMLMNTVSKDR